MRVLFITSNRLGDAVLSTGLLNHLVAEWPEARFTVACGPLPAPLFRAVPRLERIVPLAKRSFARHWFALWRACVGTRWDVIVDLRDSAVSRLLWSGRRFIHHKSSMPVHKVVELAAVLGLAEPPGPRLWLDDAARRAALALLPDDGAPLLAIGPTANWRGKEWPADRFAALARRLTDPDGVLAGGRVAVLAAGPEQVRAATVVKALGDRAIDLTGRTDPITAAACLERAGLYIGNDSGLMHIAAAVGTPTIGLFGPGFPETYGPWGERCRIVASTVPRDDLVARSERLPEVLDLMDGIAIDAVESVAVGLLEKCGDRTISSSIYTVP